MATDSNTPAAAGAATAAPVKPVKPDQAVFEKELAKLEKELADSQAKLKAVKDKIDLATPSKDKATQSPTQIRRQELLDRLKAIREEQGSGKKDRGSKLDKIKSLDDQLKSRITEQKAARAKMPFKNLEELDAQIASLEKSVNEGKMKLVDEKKALTEVSNLRKQRKSFAQFEDGQKAIDKLKADIKEIKDSLDTPEAKKLSEEYNKLQAELDAIKAEQDEAYKGLSSLRDQRTKLRQEQEEKWQAVKKFKDDYHTQRKAAIAWEKEQRQKRFEREQAERERIAKERKMERAQKMLAEASDLAYLEEIRRANSLLHFFDPSHPVAEKAPLVADKGLAAAASRKVDASGLKGTALVSKKDRDEEYLPAAKKGKKGKNKKAEAASTKFNVPPSVLEDSAFIGVDPPMSAAEVPAVLEKIKAKLEHWKADQPAQTQKNIEKAKKEIERLEAEEAGEKASGASTPKDAGKDKPVAEATEALEKTTIEEKTEEAPKAAEVEAAA
ncbi:hypothetical protein QBC35DRAFT_371529 [Podospora australis]|uniref:Nuclear segregation protein n=1 Tax=Podospora australis TaxID=1536484 RepID=A0AAN7ANT3_9PEZI|nr:hypothetical protein QBC35DRAFT_371529 [Podospora australis]